jgi:hypothetical protein
MSSHNPDWLGVLASVSSARADRGECDGPASWWARMSARVFAGRYDGDVEAGVIPVGGTPLAVHWTRLTSARERQDLAFALCAALRDAESPRGHRSRRAPVNGPAVRQTTSVIDEVLERLAGSTPVRARGMARLRLLLADGRGPVYREGRGTLTAAMRGVLAAL